MYSRKRLQRWCINIFPLYFYYQKYMDRVRVEDGIECTHWGWYTNQQWNLFYSFYSGRNFTRLYKHLGHPRNSRAQTFSLPHTQFKQHFSREHLHPIYFRCQEHLLFSSLVSDFRSCIDMSISNIARQFYLLKQFLWKVIHCRLSCSFGNIAESLHLTQHAIDSYQLLLHVQLPNSDRRIELWFL